MACGAQMKDLKKKKKLCEDLKHFTVAINTNERWMA